MILIVAPLCAVLPNATTVVLLAPVIIRVAQALDVDIAPPMILTAIVSNSAGLLTIVGDPATYLVGSSVGMTFEFYLRHVSMGGSWRWQSLCRSCRGLCRAYGICGVRCCRPGRRGASSGQSMRV
nr:SLC13 family permease [Burkholderia sp. GbtcB21]